MKSSFKIRAKKVHMNYIQKRALHVTSRLCNVVTAVCPGQGNISPHLFSLAHHQIDQLKNSKYQELIQWAQETLPEVPIAKYFSGKTYPDAVLSQNELSQTSFVQPLVLLSTYINYSIFKDMFDWDIKSANYLLGHSLGELSALVVQDVISLEEGLRVAYQRGKLMEKALLVNTSDIHGNIPKDDWGMVALMFQDRDFKSITKVCQEDIHFNIANVNGYGQIVVSGHAAELREKIAVLDQIQKELVRSKQWRSKIRKVWLDTKVPAHHPIFNDIKEELKSMIHLKSDVLYVPVVCNLNGLVVMKNSQRVVDNFVDVTSKPVQFVKCLETIVPFKNEQDETYKFLNVSEITYGLIKRVFARNEKCEVYDLISEAEKSL
ncbi:hypothetical protein PICMEDRAFT_10426 [Pichia membranifaciens NRRL Y-2026]|uniref:[acyl-carrier-protein] S-malonyltransferase n=1 Tax=Pichia membranifaciens NRRL Y-2026 TaxID=763406 RepID=A0A1E3NMT2_9ASCO|nr:hypothetical protein PICMEDRAFT_10426 [Pichia membranifaciens NRRL Y-2026]ODQ47429.1 hypothetical protein PICMEDRAFT_10426 [Pichia membranifaciens NRRL Y-2026]